MKNPKEYRSNKLHARLSFDEGYAERPIYSIKASTGEKVKAFDMIDLILTNFNITINECKIYLKKKQELFVEEMKELAKLSPTINWSRDEMGNIQSPFRSKKKLY